MASTISFKDVGIKKEAFAQSVVVVSQSLTPIGIRTPLEIDDFGKDLLVMNFRTADQIKDNLKNLLLTNHGDRVVLYDYGANINPLTTEYASEDNFDAEVMLRINTAISKYMPFVTPLEFSSTPDRETNQYVGKIMVTVVYTVPALNIFRDQIDLIIHVI